MHRPDLVGELPGEGHGTASIRVGPEWFEPGVVLEGLYMRDRGGCVRHRRLRDVEDILERGAQSFEQGHRIVVPITQVDPEDAPGVGCGPPGDETGLAVAGRSEDAPRRPVARAKRWSSRIRPTSCNGGSGIRPSDTATPDVNESGFPSVCNISPSLAGTRIAHPPARPET
jgi:hypothetical protein